MKRQIKFFSVIMAASIILFGCTFPEKNQLAGQNPANTRGEKQLMIGMPDPSAVYCKALGYELEVVTDDEGNQYGLCIFTDGSKCEAWDFYRGKCGEKWSYCKRCGYELKDLRPYEGAVKGAICIERTTKAEIGTVFDLVVDKFLKGESLPELRR